MIFLNNQIHGSRETIAQVSSVKVWIANSLALF